MNESPTQIIAAPNAFKIPLIDMTCVLSKKRDAEAQRYGRDFVLEEVDLSAGSLFDVRLLRLSELDHVLILVTDHIISDALSCITLSREIWAAYRQLLCRQEPILRPITIQFPDFAVWQWNTQESWLHDHWLYWSERLPETPICIPGDYGPSGVKDPIAERRHFPMGKSLTENLREAVDRAQCLLPLLILTLYSILMARWCERRELLVAMISHGRRGRKELDGMIGCIAHPMYLRLQFNDSDSLLDLVKQVTEEYSSACSHDASRLRSTETSDLPTEIWFNWMPADWALVQRSCVEGALGDLRTQPFPLSLTWPYKVFPFFYDTPSGVVITVFYRPDLFKQGTIDRLGRHVRWLAQQFIECPSAPIASMPALP